MYEYQATLIRVVDGDTLHMSVDLGMDINVNTMLRLLGVNTPELNTDEGKAARTWVQEWFREHGNVSGHFRIQTIKDRREKYGRYLANVIAPDNHALSADLILNGIGQAYPR